ncbi:MAG: hypothetical protein FJY92_10060 [Candidatus Hydrogenedentes bacterium]|nr:hypothetical protein [Candidatus Hydrogenedentota bacterium]
MRAQGAELREKLESELGKILSPDQVAKLKDMPGFRRGGPGGPRGDRGGREGRSLDLPAAPAAPATPTAAPAAPAPSGDAKK